MVKNKVSKKDYWENNFRGTDFFKFDSCSFAKYFDRYLSPDSSKKAIEIGAFPGTNLGYIAKKFHYIPTALDYLDNIDFIKSNMEYNGINNCKLIKKDFLTWEPKERYDVVCSHGFVEHFKNYEEVIKKHIDILKDNGILFISVPHLEYLQLSIRKHLYREEKMEEILKIHNRKIMNLAEFERIIFKKHGLKKIFSGYIREMTLWFSPDKKVIQAKKIKTYLLFKKIEKIIAKTGISNRFISPEILIIARKN